MLIFDAHLDLSLNAIEWDRDLRLGVPEIRADEAGLTDMKGRAAGTVVGALVLLAAFSAAVLVVRTFGFKDAQFYELVRTQQGAVIAIVLGALFVASGVMAYRQRVTFTDGLH